MSVPKQGHYDFDLNCHGQIKVVYYQWYGTELFLSQDTLPSYFICICSMTECCI